MNAPWMGRDGAGIVSYKGQLWLLGGWNPSNRAVFPMICNNDVWSSRDGERLDTGETEHVQRRVVRPSLRLGGASYPGYVVYKDKMWIIGGDCNQKHYQNDVWNSEDGKTWTYVNRGKDVRGLPGLTPHRGP